MTREISNSDDLIDFRDITDRVDALREDRDGFVLGSPDGEETPDPEGWAEQNPDEAIELTTLEGLLEDTAGYGGDHQWEGIWYPGTLIRHSHFVEAMRDLVEDIGDLPKGAPAYLVIDWEATAENLRADYSSVEFDGVEYWYR